MLAVEKQSPVDAESFSLQDRSIPHWADDAVCLFVAKAFKHVFDDLHVAAIRKDSRELLVGCLEQAEGRIRRAVTDLDVLNAVLIARPSHFRHLCSSSDRKTAVSGKQVYVRSVFGVLRI